MNWSSLAFIICCLLLQMVEVMPMSGLFTYQAMLERIKRKADSPTKMARAILRMLVDPAKLKTYTNLNQVDG